MLPRLQNIRPISATTTVFSTDIALELKWRFRYNNHKLGFRVFRVFGYGIATNQYSY